MGVKLLVDAREPSSLRERFPNSEVRTLDIGDFQVVGEDEKPLVVFERKTWGDFASSIRGKRLGDQTARTVAFCQSNDARPVLLLEHSQVPGWDSKETKFLDCSLAKYAIEGYSVIRTRDQKHTANMIDWLKRRCEEVRFRLFACPFSLVLSHQDLDDATIRRAIAGKGSFVRGVVAIQRRSCRRLLLQRSERDARKAVGKHAHRRQGSVETTSRRHSRAVPLRETHRAGVRKGQGTQREGSRQKNRRSHQRRLLRRLSVDCRVR